MKRTWGYGHYARGNPGVKLGSSMQCNNGDDIDGSDHDDENDYDDDDSGHVTADDIDADDDDGNDDCTILMMMVTE